MNAKKGLSASLLLFVFGSVAYMAVKEATGGESISSAWETHREVTVEGVEARVVAYFFYGDVHCSTCEKLENYALEALESNFAEELRSGALQWKTVDMDRREDEHFVTDFELYTKSVVLVEYENGEQVRWQNLEEIWDLVYDKPTYVDYIVSKTREFLDATP